jgi:hypothetical protein
MAMSMAAMITVTGCGSFGSKNQSLTPPTDSQTAVKDGTISTEFKDQGIKLFYTFTGNLDRIEVYGLAPAWKGNVDVLAEADAMDKLVKFVHGQTVSTDRRVKIMAKSLDKARDNSLNRFKSNDDNLNFDSKELENSGSENTSNNTSRRIADRVCVRSEIVWYRMVKCMWPCISGVKKTRPLRNSSAVACVDATLDLLDAVRDPGPAGLVTECAPASRAQPADHPAHHWAVDEKGSH